MPKDIAQELQHAQLGDDLTLKTETRKELIFLCQKMSSQARFRLDIISHDLDSSIFNNENYCDAVKNLALRSPKSKIRILIQNSERLIKHGHCLIQLSHRLSSYIDIRLQGKDYKEFNEAWLIIDNCGWIRRPLADKFNAECHFNSPREVLERSKQFDLMWDKSETDPNLRKLQL